MTPLTEQQKQLLFDYCIGLTSEKEGLEAERLVSSSAESAELYAKLQASLSPLAGLEAEPCPDDLAEGTIWRLNNFARSSQLRLQQLLASEQDKTVAVKSRFWQNLCKMAAAAAMIIFAAGVLIAPLSLARQKSWQQYCQMQLQRIGQAINRYSADNNGELPSVATAAGEPWWKVGYQGKENHSNTRHIWLLPKGAYVAPTDFVCPCRSQGKAMQFDLSQVDNYNDFPARRYVTYSFRIMCAKPARGDLPVPQALIADSNPLFERLPDNYSKPFKLELSKNLLTLNSINHNRRGQNVLFCDGGVKFVKMRTVGAAADDIFTLQNTNIYEGIEVPSCEADAFLAP